MASHYQPKKFFRKISKTLLGQYFKSKNVLTDIDFNNPKETKAEAIYEVWLDLPEDTRNQIDREFQEIHDMATEAGSQALLDEAVYHGENLTEQFSTLSGFHDHALWVFLENPSYWEAATAFKHADTIPQSYWRKRTNIPPAVASTKQAAIKQFEQHLGHYFHSTQGRGKNCKVDCYKRNGVDYFFAYPEDYAQASIEWSNNELSRRPHHPAFESIFVYSKENRSLEVYTSCENKIIIDLQNIFAENILNVALNENETDNRVYDLNPLKDRSFQFIYRLDSGITSVFINKFRLKLHGVNQSITLTVDPSENKESIYNLLARITTSIPLSSFAITQVGLKVKIAHASKPGKMRTVSLSISYPNSCNLKHSESNLAIQKMLVDSGIELRSPESITTDEQELCETTQSS